MALVLDGTNGVSGVDGTASNPAIEGTDSNTGIFYPAADTVAIGTGGTEALRVNSSQNVGIGTSSPEVKLDVAGDILINNNSYLYGENSVGSNSKLIGRASDDTLYVGDSAYNNPTIIQSGSNFVGINTAGSERARITSGGEFLVGTTDAGGTSGVGFKTTSLGITYTVTAASTAGTNTYHLYSTGAGAFRFYVGAEGRVYCTNTTITAISDQRLKENIKDIDVGLDAVMALKPRKFDWKEGKGKDIKGDRGWIAQEFEQVFPDMVSTWLDEPPEGEEPYKSVGADLIPILVKAIQEQQAMIDELKAKVAALESA